MSRTPLSAGDVSARMIELPGWQHVDGKLQRTFAFADFVAAFGFMAKAALVAERLDHHPDWRNVYNRVEVSLWTHDAGGLTDLDFRLAATMTQLAS